MNSTEAEDIASDVRDVPSWFCSNWPAARAAINAIVKQAANPVFTTIWSVVRSILNAVYKRCPA